MEPSKRFHSDQRICRQTTFKHLAEKGKFCRGEHFYLWAGTQDADNGKAPKTRPMIGIVASREADSRATGRNFWKRRVREIFREHQAKLDPKSICLVKIRPMQTRPSFAAMEEELTRLFKKAGVWK